MNPMLVNSLNKIWTNKLGTFYQMIIFVNS